MNRMLTVSALFAAFALFAFGAPLVFAADNHKPIALEEARKVHCYVGINAGSDDKTGIQVLECDIETGGIKVVQEVKGVIERSDIKFLYNHDNSKGFLARNKKGKGSLCIETKEDGVYFSFDCPTDNLGEYVWQRMQKGELDEMSWAFTVAEDTWRKCDDGVYERIITRFDGLYDFSVVDNSYYGIEGAVKCARFAELQEQERQENEKKLAEIKAEEERQAKEKLDEYYKQLIEDNKHYM